jgi:hypothetical protein
VQVSQLAQHLAVFSIEALDETGIVQFGLAPGLAQIAKLVQALHDRLPARRGHLLPTRKQPLFNVAPLVGSQLLPDSLALPEFLLLRRTQFVPGFKTPADSRLLIGRQILETLVILKKFFLLVRGQLLETLHSLGRQLIQVPSINAGVHTVPPRELRTVWRSLVNLAVSLAENGRAEEAGRQKRSPELGT